MPTKFECTYTEGLTISEKSLLTTMALFYDKIYLPHPYELNPNCEAVMRMPFKKQDDLDWHQKIYMSWLDSNKELIDEGVIEVHKAPKPVNEIGADFQKRFAEINGSYYKYFSSSMVFDGKIASILHAIYSDSKIPDWSRKSDEIGSQFARDKVITKWFNCEIPCYEALEPAQILELREKLIDYREGTQQYVNEKLIFLKGILGSNEAITDRALEILVESQINSEIYELSQKHWLEKAEFYAGVTKRVASFTGKVFNTVMLPWNWKNAPELIESFSDNLEHAFSHAKNCKSNNKQAFQYVNRIKRII